MSHYTSNTYQMKREILTFSNKISKKLSKPDRKFSADMIYGLLASQSKRIKKRRMEVLSFSWYTFHTLFFYTFFSFLFQPNFLWELV